MIDKEETLKRYGYRNVDLKPQSNKKIIAVCDDCGILSQLKEVI